MGTTLSESTGTACALLFVAGGEGDYLLRNDRIEAVVLAVGTTPDGTGSPFTNGLIVSGGVLIDAGTRGDRNDQLQVVAQVVNLSSKRCWSGLSPCGYLAYRGADDGFTDPQLKSGKTASITVHGAVVFGDVSSVEKATIKVVTTYSLTDGDSWIDIKTRIVNENTTPVPIYTIGDENRVFRIQLPFQPFPYRGSYAPPIDSWALGVFPWLPLPGLHTGPEAVCYSFVAPSLAEPFIGLDSKFVITATRSFDPYDIKSPKMLKPRKSMTYKRRLVVARGGAVEDCAEVAMPMLWKPELGTDARATYRGRVVTPAGDPIAGATLFFDEVSPGFPKDPRWNRMATVIDDDPGVQERRATGAPQGLGREGQPGRAGPALPGDLRARGCRDRCLLRDRGREQAP